MKIFILRGVLVTAISFFVLVPCVKGQDLDERDLVELSSTGPLEIGEITANTDKAGLYEKFELTFDLKGDWDNAFDPDQIKVDAIFIAPDGNRMMVPGFFYQEYIRNGRQHQKVGEPVWKVRFTPVLTGEYKYHVVANNKGKEVESAQQVFTIISYNANHGFVKVSKTNPLYFEYSDGATFFGIAMGRSQGDDGRSYQRFARAGGNYNRLFLTNGNFNIEEMIPRNPRPDLGLGKMNLECSWNLDKVLETGEKLGIYHILTLTNQWTFNSRWDDHTYNKANGGILNSKNEYFTSEEAMKYFERRLRYLVARWAYSTSVSSWDLWNEYSAMGADLNHALAWHKRMARYISSLDAFKHTIHTNDGSLNGRDEMHALPEMEIVSTNTYGVKNIAKVADVWTKRMITQFKKPFVLTEMGPGHGIGNYGMIDPERRMVHDGLWSPLMAGSASTGMAWEGSWLDHEKFYAYTHAVSKFVNGIPFNKRQWTPVKVSSFKFTEQKPAYYSDVIVEGWTGNFTIPKNKATEQKLFQIDKEGNVDPQEYLSAVLISPNETQTTWLTGPYGLTSSVTFKAEYPQDGEFIVYVSELRDTEPTPQLTVTIDNKQALKKDLLPLQVENYKPRIYNQYYSVKVPKGSRTIRVENSGGGSFTTAFELKKYTKKEGPDLEVRGLQSEDFILLWLKNQKFTLLHEMSSIETKPQAEGLLVLEKVPNGSWMVEWINTLDGNLFKTEVAEISNNKLSLKTPDVKESVVARLSKI